MNHLISARLDEILGCGILYLTSLKSLQVDLLGTLSVFLMFFTRIKLIFPENNLLFQNAAIC